MIRGLTTIAAVAALAVTVAPIASAGNSKKPPPRVLNIGSTEVFELNTVLKRPRAMGTRSGGEVVSDFAKAPAAMRLTATTDGTSNTLQFVTAAPQPGGTNGIIAILIG